MTKKKGNVPRYSPISSHKRKKSKLLTPMQDLNLKTIDWEGDLLSERAFVHLQRSIIVDDEIRKKWIIAYKEHETKCERLGALHLLLHGIWAFKVDAIGGKTDLVLNEPLSITTIVENTADALVLTEWKIVKAQDELQDKIKEAQKQAALYSSGVLGGIEIANYRYLVMVSEERMKMPDDQVKGIVTYRHINIAVNPDTPSVEARTG